MNKNTDPVCDAPTKLEINRRTWGDGSYFKPPMDGTPIAAIGRVITTAIDGGCSDPFYGFVRWEKDDSGYEGWHYISNGMVVAEGIDDDVKIDWWNPLPVDVA